jgi:hypothetical protein
MEVSPVALKQMNSIYSPWVEKAFCVKESGIFNVLTGSYLMSPMPICDKEDIVFHTHPPFETETNIYDWYMWGLYKERYGNKYFGVMHGKGKYNIYER